MKAVAELPKVCNTCNVKYDNKIFNLIKITISNKTEPIINLRLSDINRIFDSETGKRSTAFGNFSADCSEF